MVSLAVGVRQLPRDRGEARRVVKVLAAAIGCSPYQGSEGYVGWTAVRALARDHNVWVLVHARFREEMERAGREGLIPENLHFHYAGEFTPWHPNRLWARLQGWGDFVRWSQEALPLARELHATIGFDVVQHLTYTTWRVASELWRLPVPFLWGPLGGGETFPLRFLGVLSLQSLAFEMLRSLSNAISSLSPRVRRCARQATRLLGSNVPTRQLLGRLRGTSDGVVALSGAFFPQEKVDHFRRSRGMPRAVDGPLQLFAGGNLEGRKGVALALEALAIAKAAGLRFRYQLGGHGPELAHLRQLAARLQLTDDVVFGNSLGGEDYVSALQTAHAYLLPSLRENAGLTLMEAMLAGCVPIVIDAGGPGEMVDATCGFAIRPGNPRQVAADLAAALLQVDRDRAAAGVLGAAAAERIARLFSEDHYRAVLGELYREVVGAKEA